MAATATPEEEEHVEYEKMFESTRTWVVDTQYCSKAGKWRGLAADWCVTEKVHGANFGLIVDSSGNVKAAKRSAVLTEEDGDFFGYRAVLDRLRPMAQKVWGMLLQQQTTNPSAAILHKICIYGELFGGAYCSSTDQIPAEIKPTLVQTEILYSPIVQFYAYDIAVFTSTAGDVVRREYLDFERASNLLKCCGFLAAEPLFIGSFDKVVNYDVNFETTIPAKLGLPNLHWKAEGVVVKPYRAVVYVGDSNKPNGPLRRAILKIKAKEFLETVTAPGGVMGGAKTETEQVESELRLFVNKNRVTAAASKSGRVKKGGQQQDAHNATVAAKAVADALESCKETTPKLHTRFTALSMVQRKRIQDSLIAKALTFL